jgi:hypothetical protein
MYARALIDHAAGEPSDWLDRAIALEPRLEAEARADHLT